MFTKLQLMHAKAQLYKDSTDTVCNIADCILYAVMMVVI